jgi:hypothetical protein
MARKRSKNVAKDTHDPPKGTHEPAPPRLEGQEMPDHQKQAQAQAQEQAPKPVKLEPAKDELGAPADAPPVPPRARAEPVPRVIDQSERSPDPQRLTRFKLRCDQPFGVQPVRYVLARKGDRQGAIDHYLQTTGIRAILDTYPEGQAPRPLMAVKELPD